MEVAAGAGGRSEAVGTEAASGAEADPRFFVALLSERALTVSSCFPRAREMEAALQQREQRERPAEDLGNIWQQSAINESAGACSPNCSRSRRRGAGCVALESESSVDHEFSTVHASRLPELRALPDKTAKGAASLVPFWGEDSDAACTPLFGSFEPRGAFLSLFRASSIPSA